MADPATLAYYAQRAAERADRYEAADMGALHARLLTACPPGGRALDVGCGSGRDVAFLVREGRDAVGVDPSPAMLAEARRRHPEVADRLTEDGLPDLTSLGDARYHCVMATAVLIHVGRADLAAAVARLAGLVAPGGTLLCSVPELGEANSPDEDADPSVRRFNYHDPDAVGALGESHGLRCVDARTEDDAAGRRRKWRVIEWRREVAGG